MLRAAQRGRPVVGEVALHVPLSEFREPAHDEGHAHFAGGGCLLLHGLHLGRLFDCHHFLAPGLALVSS